MSGLFITIEGGEGVGKSTQMSLLALRLRALGAQVVTTREPGGTPVGDGIRALLLDPASVMAPRTELFLYESSRAELVASVIAPALQRGEVVVCDRFFDSTTAYQAFGRGLDPDMVRSLNLAATGGLTPDITVVLTLELQGALGRATASGADRMEQQSLDFHRRVVEGFLVLAGHEPERFRVVEASGTPEDVSERLWSAVTGHPAFVRAFEETERP